MATQYDSVDLVDAQVVKNFSRAVVLAALMGAAAYISIPLPGISITLQTFIVYIAGLYLGPIWGATSMGLYFLTGVLGAPIFSDGGAGLGHVFGPTGGFLIAFPLAAFLIGLIVHRSWEASDPSDKGLPLLAGSLVLATFVIYAIGFSWFAWIMAIPLVEAFTVVVLPFIPGDIIKLVAALLVVRHADIAAIPR